MDIAIAVGGTGGICRYLIEKIRESGEVGEIWLLTRSAERAGTVFPDSGKGFIRVIECDFSRPYELLSEMLGDGEYEVKWLLNGAGVGLIADVRDTPCADTENMIRVNCTLPSAVVSAVLPYMKSGAHIVNFASAAAFCPQPHFSVYAATKAYILSYSRALGRELKREKISVTAVCPGPVDTEFISKIERDRKINPKKKRAMADPRAVANHAYKCAKKGRAVAVYSIKMKLAHIACKMLPTSLVMKFFD